MRSSDKYNERVALTLRRSRLAEGFAAAGALATLALACVTPLAIELQVLAIGWIALAALVALRRLRAVGRLSIERSGAVEVDGVRGSVRDGSFVASWLTIVRWRPRGAWFDRTVLLAPDMLGAEDFRRVRVLLRFGWKTGSGPGPTRF